MLKGQIIILNLELTLNREHLTNDNWFSLSNSAILDEHLQFLSTVTLWIVHTWESINLTLRC